MTKTAKRRKAENGVGSVKPWKNMWRGRVTLPLLSDTTKRITIYGKTYGEAREKLNAAIYEAQRGTLTDSKGFLSEYLTSWLSRNEPELKPTTVAKYRDAKITAQLPRVRFDRLKPGQVEDALSKIQAATVERTKGWTDGKATVTKCRTLLHKVYADALRLQQVGSNPIDHTAPIKVKRKKPIMWTLPNMDRFLTAAESHRLYPMLYLAFETGMRRGELLGLRWEDIDCDRHIIHVRRNIVKAGTGLHLQDPKSETGKRDIPIAIDDPDVMTMLAQHPKRQEDERLKVGNAWAHPDMVFTSEVGTFVNPDNVTKLVKSICQAAGVPYKSIHKMRHYHLSNCHALGMPATELSNRAGHSRISTTTDIYIHDTGHRTPYSTKALRERQRRAN